MKHITTLILLIAAIFPAANAQTVSDITVKEIELNRVGKNMSVSVVVNLEDLRVKSDKATLLSFLLVNGSDSLDLGGVAYYGRNRYYHYVRSSLPLVAEGNGLNLRASEMPEDLHYKIVKPYEKWMNGAHISIERKDYGCCHKLLREEAMTIGFYQVEPFKPVYRYVRPKAEVTKTRSLSGSAFIDFPVSDTKIHPDYRNNSIELTKIFASIDSVKNDKDNTITELSIKGYASPESPYSNNTRLAMGRTQSLKEYVQKLYHFGSTFIKTSYEPEDWEGLRAYVEKSALPHKKEIISIIDLDTDPDRKEWLIKSTYRDEYDFLLKNCYPALRHSDYYIGYNIRTYTDVEEIKRVFVLNPQKLSLNEFYLLAQAYEPGSDELNYVFETAVKMYPDDEVANLNAAISEMQREDFAQAKSHLDKAGQSAEAIYARGIYAALLSQYEEALQLLLQAKILGISEAENAINQIEKLI